jgi:hypothetical protein
MQDSKIFLSSSRYESFGLAAAEALCCGCRPAGKDNLPSFANFYGLTGLGRSKNQHLQNELFSLTQISSSGKGEPENIARGTRLQVSPEAVAQDFLNLV